MKDKFQKTLTVTGHISPLQEWHDEDQSRSERFTAGIIGYLAALFANVPWAGDMLSDITSLSMSACGRQISLPGNIYLLDFTI